MRFAQPQILILAGIGVPLLALLLYLDWRKRQRLMSEFVQSRLLAQLTLGISKTRQKIKRVLIVVGVAFAAIALARPQWGQITEETRQKGRDVMVAIDVSKSMLSDDLAPNRLTRARFAAMELMRQSSGDRFGLIAFAGTAFLQCPLTLDEDAFRQNLETLDPSVIPQGGTTLSSAIKTAVQGFKDDEAAHRVLVIFTDGEDHEEGAIEAAEEAARQGLRIFTVGVGTPNGSRIRTRDENGQITDIKDERGQTVISKLNEGELKEIASKGKGFYLRLQGARSMDTLYREGLAKLPQADLGVRQIASFRERFQWPLGIAIALLLLEIFFPVRKPVEAKEEEIALAGNDSLKRAVFALTLVLLGVSRVSASTESALDAFKKGKYEESHAEYEKQLAKKPDDPSLNYNVGAAAYKAGKLKDAAAAFEAAGKAKDLKLQEQAYYNLGNTWYKIGESSEDPKAKQGAWQQAIENYNNALTLRTNDTEALFNQAFVKRKLEQLQQQQQQQQKQDKNDQSKDDKDQSKDDQKKKQDKKDKQDKQDKDKQSDKSEQKDQQQKKDQEQKDRQQQQQSKNEEQEKKDRQEQKRKEQQAKDNQAKPGEGAKDRGEKPEEPGGEEMAQAGKLSPEQAKQLLDAQRGEEKALLFKPQQPLQAKPRGFKDW